MFTIYYKGIPIQCYISTRKCYIINHETGRRVDFKSSSSAKRYIRSHKLNMVKYKLFCDDDVFNIEHKAELSLRDIKTAHGISNLVRCRKIETFIHADGSVQKTYRLDGTGYTFTIIEVM